MQNNNGGSTSPNWSFTFSGLSDVDGYSARPLTPVEGYYVCIINNTFVRDGRPNAIEIELKITEGEFKGAIISKGVTLPSHANNLFWWKSLFESLGYPADVINAPQFAPNPADWNGRTVYAYWKAGNKDLNTYRELRCMAKDAWESKKKYFESTKLASKGSAIQSNTSAIPTANATPTPLPQQSAPVSSGFGGFSASSQPVQANVNGTAQQSASSQQGFGNAGSGLGSVQSATLLNQLRGN